MISIPYGTIKTIYPLLANFCLVSFQFHTVQLKHESCARKPMISIIFQFHTVQLKPHCLMFSGFAVSISIPYGTIKTSLRGLSNDNPREISIPYGTIKTKYSADKKVPSTAFQFHTVQLKHRRRKIYEILQTIFQFHTVQLKQTQPGFPGALPNYFNSIRYN